MPRAPAAAERLAAHGILCLRAENPGPLTLSGTNTWVVGRRPAYVVDPGPLIESHIERLLMAIEARGGLGGIVLTHDHSDHAEAVEALRERDQAPLAAGRGKVDVELAEGTRFGPFQALVHARTRLRSLRAGVRAGVFHRRCGARRRQRFHRPDPGAMADYLGGLERLRGRDLDVLCPGHGPAIWEPHAKLDEYIDHRLERERLLLAALAEGRRSVEELLDAAWSDVPATLRPAAAVTLRAHLDKLEDERRLPADVERPPW